MKHNRFIVIFKMYEHDNIKIMCNTILSRPNSKCTFVYNLYSLALSIALHTTYILYAIKLSSIVEI